MLGHTYDSYSRQGAIVVRVAIVSAGYKKEELSKDFLKHLRHSLETCKATTDIYFVWAHESEIIGAKSAFHFDMTGVKHLHIVNKSFSNSMNSGLLAAMAVSEDSSGLVTINHSKYDYYLVIGNDGFPQTEGWLDKLIETQVKHGSWITCPEHDRPNISAYRHHKLFEEGPHWFYKMFPAVCWLIPDKVIEEVGLFDERFKIGCYEDDDYCKRVVDAGGHIVVDTQVKLKHLLSQTFSQFDTNKIMVENQKIYREKHKLP